MMFKNVQLNGINNEFGNRLVHKKRFSHSNNHHRKENKDTVSFSGNKKDKSDEIYKKSKEIGLQVSRLIDQYPDSWQDKAEKYLKTTDIKNGKAFIKSIEKAMKEHNGFKSMPLPPGCCAKVELTPGGLSTLCCAVIDLASIFMTKENKSICGYINTIIRNLANIFKGKSLTLNIFKDADITI